MKIITINKNINNIQSIINKYTNQYNFESNIDIQNHNKNTNYDKLLNINFFETKYTSKHPYVYHDLINSIEYECSIYGKII